MSLLTKPLNLLITLASSFLMLSLTACSHSDKAITQLPAIKPTVLISNINIVDVANNRIIENQQLIIMDGVITSISPQGSKLEYKVEQEINGNNGYLTPGLIDMHVHAYEKSAFQLSLTHGVTHVRIMNGIKEHLEWRKKQNDGWLASSMSVSSPILVSGFGQPLQWTVNNADEAKKRVNQAKAMGFDLLKAYGSLNAKSLTAIIDEAKKLSIPVAKHGPHPSGDMPWEKLNGLQSMEHAEDIYQGPLGHSQDLQKLQQTIEKLKSVNATITPTLNIYWQLTKLSDEKEDFLQKQPVEYISPIIAWEDKGNQVKRWLESSAKMARHNNKTFKFLSSITGELYKNNIPLLVGSDAGVLLSPHGLATHNEMRLMHKAGMSNFDVLKSATLLPAKALNKTSQLGQIKVGLQADMIFTQSDPTSDLSALINPHGVVKNGYWLSKKQLKALRKHALKQQSWWDEMWAIIRNY